MHIYCLRTLLPFLSNDNDRLFLVFDAAYILVDANDTALQWFGQPRDTMHEISMVDRCHPDHLQRTYQAMAASEPHTNLVRHASGAYRWCNWRPIKSRNLSGFFYAAGRDVTNEIEDRSNAESFIRSLCHEIRNPLLGIMGVSDMLVAATTRQATFAEGNEEGEESNSNIQNNHVFVRDSIETIRNCCVQLHSVVNTTLNVSKLESGKNELAMAPFQPHAVLQTSVDVMSGFAMARRVQLKCSNYPNMKNYKDVKKNTIRAAILLDKEGEESSINNLEHGVESAAADDDDDDDDNVTTSDDDDAINQYYVGDKAWISQILVNLISNSIKFTREDGQVMVNVQVTDRQPSSKDVDQYNDVTAGGNEDHVHQGSTLVGASSNMKRQNAVLQDMDKWMVFTVQDTGEGMTESQRSELFQPFMNSQLKTIPGTSIATYTNCGLGLHISHSVVTRMGGTIEVQSTLGKGTTVHVKIPTKYCAGPEPDALAKEEALHHSNSILSDEDLSFPSKATSKSGINTHGDDVNTPVGSEGLRLFPPMKIMVVDDVSLNRAIAIRWIRQMGAHDIFEACDGFSCIDTLTSAKKQEIDKQCLGEDAEKDHAENTRDKCVDLILMDVSMPGIDGLETTRRIRNLLPPEAQPFVAGVSAFSSEQDRKTALDAGMDAYLVKPYRMVDLQRILQDTMKFKEQERYKSDSAITLT